MLYRIFFKILIACLVNACATSPTGRTQLAIMPDSQVNQMGLQAFDSLKKEKPISERVEDSEFVSCITDALTHGQSGRWEVVIFKDDSLNAFALPGNKIGVHTGMINFVDNQDQLAAVIGHEIGHVIAKHSNERLSQKFAVSQGLALIQAVAAPQSALGQSAIGLLGVGAQYGVILPYSRIHESEADIIGLELMAKAGFDPEQSVVLWQKMGQASQGQQPPEFVSTHPSHTTRIDELNKKMPNALELYRRAISLGKKPSCKK